MALSSPRAYLPRFGSVVTSGIATALAFVLVPWEPLRALLVIVFGVIAGLSTVGLLATVAYRALRHWRWPYSSGPGVWKKSWAVLAVLGIVFDAVVVVGLNFYAATKTQATIALIEDSYADVDSAVALGNAIKEGKASPGASFSIVEAKADVAYLQLGALDVAGQLLNYQSAVKAWARDVAIRARDDRQWPGVSTMPEPFALDMTLSDADSAYLLAMQQTASLIRFGSFAVSSNNSAAMPYVGARVDALTYWLDGVYASRDPNGVIVRLSFIERPSFDLTSNLSDQTANMRLTAAMSPYLQGRTSRGPRVNCSAHRGFAPCGWPTVRSKFGNLSSAALATRYCFAGSAAQRTTSTPLCSDAAQQWTGATQDAVLKDAVQAHGPPPSSPLSPQQAFEQQCQSEEGKIVDQLTDMQRLPTLEDGWECLTNNSKCWTFLTYSGRQYRGGQPGCPEQGLLPPEGGPLGPVVAEVGGFLNRVVQVAPTWDGTYNLEREGSCQTKDFPPGAEQAMQNGLAFVPPGLAVSGNRVVAPTYSGGTIDSSGHATIQYANQGVTSTGTFQFTRDAGGLAHVVGIYVITISPQSRYARGSANCSVKVRGTKN